MHYKRKVTKKIDINKQHFRSVIASCRFLVCALAEPYNTSILPIPTTPEALFHHRTSILS